jgi:stalled ribosome alternative rescue factor ArfA
VLTELKQIKTNQVDALIKDLMAHQRVDNASTWSPFMGTTINGTT